MSNWYMVVSNIIYLDMLEPFPIIVDIYELQHIIQKNMLQKKHHSDIHYQHSLHYITKVEKDHWHIATTTTITVVIIIEVNTVPITPDLYFILIQIRRKLEVLFLLNRIIIEIYPTITMIVFLVMIQLVIIVWSYYTIREIILTLRDLPSYIIILIIIHIQKSYPIIRERS